MSRSLAARDRDVLWHPATHFADLDRLPPLPIRAARGAWLEDETGRRILDGISSWWTCLHGHGHPRIVEAIAAQVGALDHVMLAGFTHEPAVALAEALLDMAGPGYGKVFYADCGSAAIEVALKLSFQSHQQRGETHRRRFATLANSYHGETLGALAVCGHDTYRGTFAPLLMDVLELPCPAFPDHRHADLETDLGADSPQAEAAVEILEDQADTLAALVMEPLVQCAGKMAMPGAGFYRRLAETAQGLGIHVIADEIAVGFGRTGRMLASPWAGVTPDLMCVSKGLSGGVLPLAAVLIREHFEDDFKGAPNRSFLHSHTFTGNPVTCAAGLASLGVFEEESRIEALSDTIQTLDGLRQRVCGACPSIAHSRQAGTIVAFDLDLAKVNVPDGRLGLALREAALGADVLLRPLHDTIYWMPPLSCDDGELERLAVATIHAIGTVATGGS